MTKGPLPKDYPSPCLLKQVFYLFPLVQQLQQCHLFHHPRQHLLSFNHFLALIMILFHLLNQMRKIIHYHHCQITHSIESFLRHHNTQQFCFKALLLHQQHLIDLIHHHSLMHLLKAYNTFSLHYQTYLFFFHICLLYLRY